MKNTIWQNENLEQRMLNYQKILKNYLDKKYSGKNIEIKSLVEKNSIITYTALIDWNEVTWEYNYWISNLDNINKTSENVKKQLDIIDQMMSEAEEILNEKWIEWYFIKSVQKTSDWIEIKYILNWEETTIKSN